VAQLAAIGRHEARSDVGLAKESWSYQTCQFLYIEPKQCGGGRYSDYRQKCLVDVAEMAGSRKERDSRSVVIQRGHQARQFFTQAIFTEFSAEFFRCFRSNGFCNASPVHQNPTAHP